MWILIKCTRKDVRLTSLIQIIELFRVDGFLLWTISKLKDLHSCDDKKNHSSTGFENVPDGDPCNIYNMLALEPERMFTHQFQEQNKR